MNIEERIRQCESCFLCEKGVAKYTPDGKPITPEMIRDAKASGGIPLEWLSNVAVESCDKCFNCMKCDTQQEKCDKCFTCMKCDKTQGGGQPQITTPTSQENKSAGEQRMTYFVFLTNDCNLRCTYCYATKTPPTMTPEILDAALDFIFNKEEKRMPGRQISVQFFGGEPTVKWNMLVQFVEKGNMMARKMGKTVNWGMTTNGTLLNENKFRWLRHHGFTPLFSIDGPKKIHDTHRLTRDGKGSFSLIPLTLIKRYYPGAEIRPTIMPDTVEFFPASLEWFYSQGFTTVATEVAYEADWNEEAMNKARIAYEKLGELYVRRRNAGLPMWMKFIEDGRNFLGVKNQTGTVCGIARNTVAIDANGNLFACQRYASFSNPALKLGDVFKGWEKIKLEQTNDFKREYMHPDFKSDFFCDECPAFWRCRGGCNAMNFQCNGDRRIILVNNCKFQRLWATIALRTLAATGELWQKMGNSQGGKCRV